MSDVSLLSFSETLATAVETAAPSVVQVHGRRRPASGVVFGHDLVVTTSRALGKEDGLRVRAGDGRGLDAELVGWDPASGLVVLKAAGLDAPVAVASDVPARVGHVTLAVARSWSNAITATQGIVSIIGGPLPTGPGRSIDRIIRTTAAMHSGFAGGALIDVTGRVTGLTTAAEIRGLGVVIPADIVWTIATSLAQHGSIKRGYLGIAGQPVRLPERHFAGEDRSHALLVVAVSSGSPAEAGGILIGDVVVRFDGRPVQSPVDLLDLLQGDRVGKTVTVSIVRGGVPQDLAVTVGERERSVE